MGKYGFLVRKHEFFLKKPILLRGLEKLRRQSDNLNMGSIIPITII
jgi:hypothetical protein